MQYNWKLYWKLYWKLPSSDFSQVKMIHFHSPKLGRGLEELATCNVIAMFPEFEYPEYLSMMMQSVCCDRGRVAEWSLQVIHNLKAPMEDVCY